jgi:hypothetical protein
MRRPRRRNLLTNTKKNMPSYFRIIPAYIANSPLLSSSEKQFCSLLISLCKKTGFCKAFNSYLLQQLEAMGMPVCIRTLNLYLSNLKRLGFIKIELEFGNSRRISILPPPTQKPIETPQNLTPGVKKRAPLIEIAEKELGTETNKTEAASASFPSFSSDFSSKNLTHNSTLPPQSPDFAYEGKSNLDRLSSLEAKVSQLEAKIEAITSFLKQERPIQKFPPGHPDRWPGPINPDFIALPRLMTRETPPNPGPQEMVDQVKEILDRPIQIGPKKYLLDIQDKAYFFGWSRSVLVEAIARVHTCVMSLSKNGRIPTNIPAMIFKSCAEVRRERK